MQKLIRPIGLGLLFITVVSADVRIGASGSRPAAAERQPDVRFPRDPSILNAKTDFGARGDGITDDTEALQAALDAGCGVSRARTAVLYIPDGVYKVSRTLVVQSALGPWLYGQSRDGVVIRLADGAKECTAVLRTHPNDGGSTSADWFMRNLRNFTIDVGRNPNTDGIRWFATNSGILQNIRVVGSGRIGINAGFMGQSGPNLIQDAVVEGFETGILSQWIWGETMSGITIRNCRSTGIVVNANCVAIEDLTVENTHTALVVDMPNDWYWWGGVAAVIGANLRGRDATKPAILNRGSLYARDVKAVGFSRAIESSSPNGSVSGPIVSEYSSHPARSAFETTASSLRLAIKREPRLPPDPNTNNWVCANDFGAAAGDNRDDTQALQAAVDAAARAKKTTVYLRGVGGPDPNWYTLDGEVTLHGSVRHIIGLGFARILRGKIGRFVVTDASARMVKFQHLDSFGGPPVILENRSSKSTMVVESCGVKIVGDGAGDIFVTDCPADVEMKRFGQKLWARQLNPEGDSDDGLVRNRGADLWLLGVKHEGRGVRISTSAGGKTELFGMFNYHSGMPEKDPRPIFDVDNARMSAMAVREITFGTHTYTVKLREKRGSEVRTLGAAPGEHGWIGWALLSAGVGR